MTSQNGNFIQQNVCIAPYHLWLEGMMLRHHFKAQKHNPVKL